MKKFGLILLLILITSTISHSQWVQTNGPYIAYGANSLYTDNISLYALTNAGGISKFNAVTNKWQSIPSPSYLPKFIVKHNSKLIAGSGGLDISNNEGITWQRITNGIPSSQSSSWGSQPPYTVQCMASFHNNVFVGFLAGLYRSIDDGNSFHLSLSKFINSIDNDDSTVYAGGYGIFKSNDNGNTWIDISGIAWVNYNRQIRSIKVIGKFLFVINTDLSCYRSSDKGNSWKQINDVISNSVIFNLLTANNKIFVQTNSGFYISHDFGDTWQLLNPFPNNYYINDITFFNNKLYSCTVGNIYYSLDWGNTWTTCTTEVPTSITSLSVNGSSIFASGISLFRSQNNGLTWEIIGSKSNIVFADENSIYIGDRYGKPLVSKSTNNGQTWESIINGLYNVQDIQTIHKKGQLLFLGTDKGVFISTNNGNNWSESNSGLSPVTTVYTFAFDNNSIYAGTWNGVFKSTNNGDSWHNIGCEHIKVIAASEKKIYTGSFDSKCLYQAINTSNVSPLNWVAVQTENKNVRAIITYGESVFAGTEGGIFLSKDNGKNWQNISAGLGGQYIECLAIKDGYIFAGTNSSSVWKRPLSEIVTDAKEKDESLPVLFSLSQNYPNPFNPTTNIVYSIPQAGHVSLKVYDMLGREVATLVDEFKQPGNYNSQFSIQNYTLPSGVYFYCLQCGSFTETKKLVLLK